MDATTLTALFIENLEAVYYAEKKVLKLLPKMAKASPSEEVAAVFEKQRSQKQAQIERLEDIFAILGKRPASKTCHAIDRILEEGEETMKNDKDTPSLVAGLLMTAKTIESYENFRYDTLKSWAKTLNLAKIEGLLSTPDHEIPPGFRTAMLAGTAAHPPTAQAIT